MRHTLSVLLFILTTAFLANVACCDERPGEQREARLDSTSKVEMGYLLYLPEDYEKQEAWPLLVFLHGVGERGDNLQRVAIHGPPKLIAAGKDFPFIVVSPQCPSNQWWEPTELVALLDEIERTCKVDADRVYLTGLSMGGFGTWRLAAYVPQRFAAIAPICGGGEPYWGRQIAQLPTWAFHGAKDRTVPLKRSEDMIEAIKEAGGTPQLTIYPEAGHDSWTETYNNPKLYEWLLSQKRAGKD